MTTEEDTPHLQRPNPIRPFSLTPNTSNSSPPSTPPDPSSSETFISHTRSVLNLTSSTLFGIYAPVDYDSNRTQPPTPGTHTPLPRSNTEDDTKPPIIGSYSSGKPPLKDTAPPYYHLNHSHSTGGLVFRIVRRTVLLFCFGVAYGIIITHLHDSQRVAPVQVQGIDRWGWRYLVGWGIVGVALGGLLPWVDALWVEMLGNDIAIFPSSDTREDTATREGEEKRSSSRAGQADSEADWNPVVRSIGAFIGIAFAIRRLPWQSTLQVSLTLALVNPVLWYVVDRSKPGFLLSLMVGLWGTAVVFGVNPDIVPTPATPSSQVEMELNASHTGAWTSQDGLVSHNFVGVATWIASVFFCGSVCFGNIGRRLALRTGTRRGSVS